MREAKVIKGADLDYVTGQEPPLTVKQGIHSSTVDDPKLKMYRVFVPAGARNQRHYHVNSDAGMHILKGRLEVYIGPDCEMKTVDAVAGDFIFAPAGIIHGFRNVSDTEPVELVAVKSNVANDEQEGTIFVEPSWVK